MSRIRGCLLALLFAATATHADVLELRDGRTLEGRLTGANEEMIRFETATGVSTIPKGDAAALRFGAAGSTPGKPPTGASERRTGGAAVAVQTIQVPAGTRLRVRIRDTLDPRQSTKGDRFSALLETPIAVEERPIVPAQTVVYGSITAASPTGPALQQLRLELEELQISGRPVAIVTGPHARIAEAPREGVPANAAETATARVPAGALLEFRLLQPLELKLAR